jgi:hypothetical protein
VAGDNPSISPGPPEIAASVGLQHVSGAAPPLLVDAVALRWPAGVTTALAGVARVRGEPAFSDADLCIATNAVISPGRDEMIELDEHQH